jgi:hypothetical protein
VILRSAKHHPTIGLREGNHCCRSRGSGRQGRLAERTAVLLRGVEQVDSICTELHHAAGTPNVSATNVSDDVYTSERSEPKRGNVLPGANAIRR